MESYNCSGSTLEITFDENDSKIVSKLVADSIVETLNKLEIFQNYVRAFIIINNPNDDNLNTIIDSKGSVIGNLNSIESLISNYIEYMESVKRSLNDDNDNTKSDDLMTLNESNDKILDISKDEDDEDEDPYSFR